MWPSSFGDQVCILPVKHCRATLIIVVIPLFYMIHSGLSFVMFAAFQSFRAFVITLIVFATMMSWLTPFVAHMCLREIDPNHYHSSLDGADPWVQLPDTYTTRQDIRIGHRGQPLSRDLTWWDVCGHHLYSWHHHNLFHQLHPILLLLPLCHIYNITSVHRRNHVHRPNLAHPQHVDLSVATTLDQHFTFWSATKNTQERSH